MIKKIIICVFTLLLVGCGMETQTIDKANGDSKTYLFFKDLDPNNYYLELWDRNNSKNDDTKIIMARKGDEYYYEMDGVINVINIWKDGYVYNIDGQMKNYNKQESAVKDYSHGILPNDIKGLRTKGYETGEEKIYGKKYIYEKYVYDNEQSTYYFSGDDLVYIKYQGIQITLFYRFNLMQGKADDDLFKVPDGYLEVTY